MGSTANDCAGFADVLGLEPGAGDLFVGRIRGFPVGLKFIDPAGAVLLLFQVRHWLTGASPQLKSVTYDEEVAKLLAHKSLEIEFDDHIAWLTFSRLGECIQSSEVARLLDSILEAFAKAGFIGDPALCHYCQKEKVDSITSVEGKVAQICPACLEERVKKVKQDSAAPAAEAVPILLMSPGAALCGAVLWAAFWIAHTLLFERLGIGVVFVPRLVMAVVMVGLGLLVGGPVGWIIKQNRKRGKAASLSAAVLFGSLAVIAGEVFHLTWLIYRDYGVVSFTAALHVMPAYYLGNDPLFLAFKAVAAAISIGVACFIAKPQEPTLKL
jgi:hypothetical protein